MGAPMKGKVVLVTGAAKRIGRAIAVDLGSEGARVAVHYGRSRQEAEETVRLAGDGARAFGADLRSTKEIGCLSEEVYRSMGRIDFLVNNAALFGRTPFFETTEEEWDRFHDVNLKGAFFLTQAVARVMKEGAIVNIADTGGVRLWPGYLAYGASKAGLVALTRGLARALAPKIRVNGVLPGPMLPPEGEGDLETLDEAASKTLLKRPGRPEDVARAVRFLIESPYVTGALLPVDGGRLAAGG